MFKQTLAALGIGGATIDAILESPSAEPGGMLQGRLLIQGGSVPQEVRSIELSVETEYIQEHDNHTSRHSYVLGRYRLPQALRTQPGAKQEVPFSIQVPWGAPITVGGQQSWLKSQLDVEAAIDPKDHDEILVRPTPLQARLLQAMEKLGFSIYRAYCEKSRLGRGVPFVQEVEMKPRSGAFRGRLDEVDVVMWPSSGNLEVLLEVDRRARGLVSFFAEAMDLDESRLLLRFSERDLARGVADWADQIGRAIQSHA